MNKDAVWPEVLGGTIGFVYCYIITSDPVLSGIFGIVIAFAVHVVKLVID